MQRQNSQITMDVDEANDENAKKIGDNVVPSLLAEPLLRSITTNTVVKEEKGMQIRSSARVSKKMKLEQEQDKKQEDPTHTEVCLTSPNSDNSLVSVSTAEKITEPEVKGQPVRCSTRVVKKVKQEPAIPAETKIKKEEPKTDIRKETRKWTAEDKIMFFEAVNEFGRDFENIQQYINSKLKKKGASDEQMRSKLNVRQFYMRTFHEVSKHVKFSDGVKKVVQELYGIINYGELFKKLCVITEKAYMKLSELIYRGETCIRIKGKMHRIKTPMCRALIKLNQLDQKYEEVKLPNRVFVELRPKDMTSYIKVQCLAQNPRLRTTLPIQKRLSSLIECLRRRWRSADALNYEKSIVSNNLITSDYVPPKQEIEENMQLFMPKLILSPPVEAKIELPSINISEYLTRQTICLTAYESRLGLDTFSQIKKMSRKKKPNLVAEPKVEVIPKVDVEPLVEVCDIKMEENEVNNYYETEADSGLADAVDDAVNTILSLQTLDRQQSETSETEELPVKQESQPQPNPLEVNKEDLERIEKIKKGWTETTSESLTIGEIYLMYGSDSKLILEYCWGNEVEEPEKAKKSAANFLEMWNESYEERKQRNLTSALSKLLSLAKLHYMENAVKGPGAGLDRFAVFALFANATVDAAPDSGAFNNQSECMGASTDGLFKVMNCCCCLKCMNCSICIAFKESESFYACPCGHVCSDKPIKNSTSVGGSRIRKATVVDNGSALNSIKTEENGPDVPNETTEVTSTLFRPPKHIIPNGPAIQAPTMQQQLNSIQRLKPKFCNRKGRRPRHKPIVVERKLPLLPNNLSGHQIVRMSIISQEPPSAGPKVEHIDVAIASTSSSAPQQEIDLQKVITDPDEDNSIISTVPSSPSRILKEGDSEWINAEVADYSLSSLLGHLESPVKIPVPMGTLNSNMASDLSSEVDAQLQSLMTENSMDFAASFADLAASVVSDRKF